MIVSDIVNGKKNKDRVNVYIDGEYSFSLYLDTLLMLKIKIGSEIDKETIEEALLEDEYKYAFDTGLKFLARKMRSKKEIVLKLREKEVSEGSIEYATEKLEELGYIDDEEYARLYTQQVSGTKGIILIKDHLMEKGISKDIINDVLEDLSQKDIIEQKAYQLKERYRNDDKYKQKQKVYRALMTKGFDYDDIKKAVAKVFSEETEEYYD